MIRYECDKCGRPLKANDAARYIVRLEVYAAAGHVNVDVPADESTSAKLDELLEQLASADPDEVEDQTYRSFRFDVCDACRRRLIANPLQR